MIQQSDDIISMLGVANQYHALDDVAEVNSFITSMLPGSFLYEKEPGYEATTHGTEAASTNSFNLETFDVEQSTKPHPIVLFSILLFWNDTVFPHAVSNGEYKGHLWLQHTTAERDI